MADVAMWTDKKVKAEFEAKARSLWEELQPELEGQEGMVAIEPESGEYFRGRHPGQSRRSRLCPAPRHLGLFCAPGQPRGAIALPTW